jgi:hypothetical protein
MLLFLQMTNSVENLYEDWVSEQTLLQAESFEEENKILKELSQDNSPTSPDWSTWCNTLCS